MLACSSAHVNDAKEALRRRCASTMSGKKKGQHFILGGKTQEPSSSGASSSIESCCTTDHHKRRKTTQSCAKKTFLESKTSLYLSTTSSLCRRCNSWHTQNFFFCKIKKILIYYIGLKIWMHFTRSYGSYLGLEPPKCLNIWRHFIY